MKPWDNLFSKWQIELKELKKIEIDPAKMGAEQKKLANLENKAQLVYNIQNLEKNLENAKNSVINEKDDEMKLLWQEEVKIIETQIASAEKNLSTALIPNEQENLILEIRSGEGGDEAALFAMELYAMYTKLCKKKNWNISTFSTNYSENGGLKEGVFEISGKGVATWLFSESGVHCVKRIPKTEKKGRTHTSTATVAILPEPTEVEIIINEKDLKIDVFRSSGPGGQSVNTTDSAVRITHIPTGIVVSQQDEKSQHKNKEKALKILKARIYQKKLEEIEAQHSENRRQAIGSAKRNERIRTYHFMQNWVKDIRLETTCHNVAAFMEADALLEFLEELVWEALE